MLFFNSKVAEENEKEPRHGSDFRVVSKRGRFYVDAWFMVWTFVDNTCFMIELMTVADEKICGEWVICNVMDVTWDDKSCACVCVQK